MLYSYCVQLLLYMYIAIVFSYVTQLLCTGIVAHVYCYWWGAMDLRSRRAPCKYPGPSRPGETNDPASTPHPPSDHGPTLHSQHQDVEPDGSC